jgi:ribonucleoside-triphosphate reductase (formate)
MQWLVRKLNGSISSYDRVKIQNFIIEVSSKSNEDVDIDIIVHNIENSLYYKFFENGNIPHTKEIIELSCNTLFRSGYTQTADILRKGSFFQGDNKNFIEDLVDNYINSSDWRVKENSNMNYSLQGLNFHISSSIVARYWLSKLYTDEIKKHQDDGSLHIHDLGILGPYCVGWDLQELLEKGFGGVPNKIESSPAKHFRSILGQIVNFFYTLQGEAAGAQAFSNFDTLLAPFVRNDNLSYDEVKQAMQEFIFNLNVPTRVGFQAPFTNITLDLEPAPVLSDTNVVIGGKIQDSKYGDFQPEMDMINKALAELMSEGDAKGRIFTFPIPTYNIHKDFDFDNPNFIPIWEMTGKYGIPYFSNFVNSDLSPDDVRSMCCRLRLDTKELRSRGGGLFGANPQTGSIGVVTINIPRIAYLAENEEDFYSRLDKMLELAKNSLEIKRTFVEQLTDQGLFPYTKVYLSSVKERFGCWWANHFSTIGIIGMNEAAHNFLKTSIVDPKAHKWTGEVLTYIRNRLQQFQSDTGNYYNLEATPAEGASYRLAKKDKEIFGDIFAQGGDDVPYYTNSVHVPANEEMDLFDMLEHQDNLQTLFTGGTVVHLYLGEAITDTNSVKELVKSVVNNYKLPYFSLTPTFSVCPVHGYISGKHQYCPYPHTEKDLKDHGKITEIEENKLTSMEKSSYKVIKNN